MGTSPSSRGLALTPEAGQTCIHRNVLSTVSQGAPGFTLHHPCRTSRCPALLISLDSPTHPDPEDEAGEPAGGRASNRKQHRSPSGTSARSLVSNTLRSRGLYSLPGSSVHGDSPGKNTTVGSLSILQGNLPNPGTKPRSPALQADSLLIQPSGKAKNTGVGSLSFLQGIFLMQESHQGLLHCRRILYQLSYQGSPNVCPTGPPGSLPWLVYNPCTWWVT